MYVDKSERLAVSMEIKDALKSNSPYKKGDRVTGTVYHVGKSGILVAVDDIYDGRIPKQEMKGIYHAGDTVEVRVANVLDDGKLTLSLRDFAHVQMLQDSDVLLGLMEEMGGKLPVGDKSDPEAIKRLTGMTKKPISGPWASFIKKARRSQVPRKRDGSNGSLRQGAPRNYGLRLSGPRHGQSRRRRGL